jgi:hypothetical protein
MLLNCVVSWFRRDHRPTPTPKAAPTLEALENRLVPTVAANDLFVSSLYQSLLGRNVDQGGLAYWAGQLNAGVSRTQVAQQIGTSNEALNYDVDQFYEVLLGHPADAASLNYWTGQLKAGATLDQVKGGILGSGEFYGLAGNTDANFLNALYTHELNRPVDGAGLNYWEGQLNAGVSRTQVADEILTAPEALNVKVTSFYQDVLGRNPDAVGLNYWEGQLQAGTPETQVLAGLLGSSEYYAKVQNLAATTSTGDPNQAASNLITSQNLFTGPRANAEYLAHKPAYVPPTFQPVPPDVDPPTGNVDTSGNFTPQPDNSDSTPAVDTGSITPPDLP